MDIIYQLQGVEFAWAEEKARSNIADHGVTFEEAATAHVLARHLQSDEAVAAIMRAIREEAVG